MPDKNPVNKMVVFDMDNTLLQGKFIDECAERLNFKQALNLLRQIDHDSVSLTIRIASFLKGQKRSVLIDVVKNIQLTEGIADVVRELKRRSYIVGIISNSYQAVAEFVAEQINADFWLANELQYEGDYLTGAVLIPSYFHYSEESLCKHQVCKTNALRYACHKYKTKLENCTAVGDGENDICMIRNAGLGVAWCTTNELLKKEAKQHIEEQKIKDLLLYTI